MGTWRKSTYSGGTGGSCVEVADAQGSVTVRDTKQDKADRRTVVEFSLSAWSEFIATLK